MDPRFREDDVCRDEDGACGDEDGACGDEDDVRGDKDEVYADGLGVRATRSAHCGYSHA